MKPSPRVSIGMPVYNAERSLGRALDSLLAQEFAHFELLLSDNASTDGTQDLCRAYVGRDSRVAYRRQGRNVGQLANFDLAAAAARGEYFMWAADDDYWEPGFIGAMVEELDAHPEAGLAMCGIRRVREDGATLDVVRFGGAGDPWSMGHLGTAMALTGGFANKRRYHLYLYGMFRAELVRRARPYGALPVPHPDRVFMTQYALAARWRYVDQVLYVRTVHDRPGNVRLPDEQFNRLINESRWGYARTALAVAPYVARSRIVPWRRKLYVPIVAVRMWWSYRSVLYRGHIPAPLRLALALGRGALNLVRRLYRSGGATAQAAGRDKGD